MKKRIAFLSLAFIVILICGIALITPPKNAYKYVCKTDDIVKTLTAKDIAGFHDCQIDENGNITVIGGDPYVVFDNVSCEYKTVSIKTGVMETPFRVQMFVDNGSGYSEGNSFVSSRLTSEDEVVFVFNESNEAVSLRFDTDSNYTFKEITLHSDSPQAVPVKLTVSPWRYVICVIIDILIVALLFYLDYKYKFIKRFFAWCIGVRFTVLKGVIAFVICAIIAALAEAIIGRFIVGLSTAGTYFNVFRFLFILSILFTVAFLILCAKIADKKIENVFLGVALILGLSMVLICPSSHASWDVDTHYCWSLNTSHIGAFYYSDADIHVFTNGEHYWIGETAAENFEKMEQMEQMNEKVLYQRTTKFQLSHVPSGLFMAVARMFGGNFYITTTFGKIANVLIYAIVCYFAIKRLKSGKMIATVVALIPTSLFIASSFAYDFWVTCFSILGTAYFVGEMQRQDEPVTVKNTLIMCIAFALACLPKLIYAPLMLLPFFLKKKNFNNRKRYYIICAMVIVALGVLLLLKSFSVVTSTGDLRGGGAVSPKGQIKFILYNPISYAKILIKFILEYLSVSTMPKYITNFAYLGEFGTGAIVFMILMLVTAFTDKNEYDVKAYGWLNKILSILMYVGMAVLMATALYIDFTPVGEQTIAGCQPRYIIPLLYPLLSMVGWGGFKNKMNKGVYNYLVLIPCCIVVFYNIGTMMLGKWI